MNIAPSPTQLVAAPKSTASDNDAPKKTRNSSTSEGQAQFSSDVWSPGKLTGFSMSAYTAGGTLVEVESHSRKSFSMGSMAKRESPFKMTQKQANDELSITFTTAKGTKQSFNLTENSRFLEREDGSIVLDNGTSTAKNGAGKDARDTNAIIVNLANGGRVNGGSGDDVIFNLGAGAVLDGGDGNDIMFSMGDNASLLGGNGDDLLKVVRDVLRREDVGSGSTFASTDAALQKKALLGYDKGMRVFMDAGEGDNTLESEVKLHNSAIKAGDGNNTMRFGVLQNSQLSMGNGNNSIMAETLYASSIDTGDGDNNINAGTLAHSSRISTGGGHETITVSRLLGGSAISSGAGNDNISVTTLQNSLIDAGAGDDNISASYAESSVIRGGMGNDSIHVDNAERSVIDGGEGDDTIFVKYAYNSMVMGGAGNDTISLGGSRLIVDGGAGVDSMQITGSDMIKLDDGKLLEHSLTDADAEAMGNTLNATLDSVPLDGTTRQKYKAMLQYALQARAF